MAAHANTHAHTSHSATPEARQARRDTALVCACAGMLGLTLLSFHAVGGTYAKYVAKGTGSDTARVAKFGTVQVTVPADLHIDDLAAWNQDHTTPLTDAPAVAMSTTEVAAKVYLSIKAPGWNFDPNAGDGGNGALYFGGTNFSGADVWFELGEGWGYAGRNGDTFNFTRLANAGQALDAPIFQGNELHSSLTVEERLALATDVLTLSFSAQAIQID